MTALAREVEERAVAERVLGVEDLVVRFGEVEAVRGISFAVSPGESFGLLGPNGAGKTTHDPRPDDAAPPDRRERRGRRS